MRLRRKCLERRFGKRPLECPILDPIQVGHDAYPVHTCLGGYPGNWGRISLAQACMGTTNKNGVQYRGTLPVNLMTGV
eukprot:2127772-Rhodomonas_salina.4